jgi:hypothetical protein
MVTSQPKYFASIRGNNLGLATNSTVVSRIRANYATIKNLYPPAVFPPVTMLVGATWKPDAISKFTLLQNLTDRNRRLNVL